MHIALTGASGFLGSEIARALHAQGHSVTALVRSTSRRDHLIDSVDRFVEGDQADERVWPALLEDAECLVHNAFDFACLKSGDLNRHYHGNLLGSMKLIDAALPRRVVYMSSIAVHHDMRPRWEGRIDEDHPTRPANLYGAAKAAVETHLWARHFGDGLTFCSVRPCAVYGHDPRPTRSIGWPIVQSIRAGKPFDRPGGGKFVDVRDVAAITAAAATAETPPPVVNLADCYARWADLATMIADILGVEVEIDLTSPASPRNVFTKDAARLLGVELNRGHEGLRDYLESLVALVPA